MGDSLFDETKQPLKYAAEKIPNNYQQNLMMSKLRNPKLLNKSEKKKYGNLEQGFSLYFNGANSNKTKATLVAPRKVKTSNNEETLNLERTKTAPERKNWNTATKIGFLTNRGDKLIVKPNSYYSDDFEELDDNEIKEEILNDELSLDLSINDVRTLRNSLVFKDRPERNNDLTFRNLDSISEEPTAASENEKIFTLELKPTETFRSKEKILNDNQTNNDGKLREIIDRVLRMNDMQQAKLLFELEKIEEVYNDEEENVVENEENPQKIESFVDVCLLIEENWGHPDRVGLTEVEFWDRNKTPIRIDRVKLNNNSSNSSSSIGDVSNLINNHKDTIKEKHMWSCKFQNNRPISIDFRLLTNSRDEICSVIIWNFNNKSMDSLSIGAKKVVVKTIQDGAVLCEGMIDKALGKQAINPPSVLNVNYSNKSREQERTVKKQRTNSADISSDDECLLDKLQNVRKTPSEKLNLKEEKPLNSSFLMEELSPSRKNSARFGRRSEMDFSEGRDQLKELVDEFNVLSFGGNVKTESLEQSWTSLRQFDKQQAGRLSMVTDDIFLDEYIDKIQRESVLFDVNEEKQIVHEDEVDDFIIPELPIGLRLEVDILTTWGDPHYVGLTGIEMFSASGGRPIDVKFISADPPDINVLPGYGSDPRVVQNLLDGVNRTRDDVHMWLAPFTSGHHHRVTIEFREQSQLALLRIWNYNKSRIHSLRGARDVEVTLDDRLIFRGEIGRASGAKECQESGEVILFTDDDEILELIGQHDEHFTNCDSNNDSNNIPYTSQANELLQSLAMRPPTAKERSSSESLGSQQKINGTTRPFTCTRITKSPDGTLENAPIVRILIGETWGDKYYVGLTGLQFIDGSSNTYNPVVLESIQTNTVVLENDCRTIDKLFDETTLTVDDEHMWLTTFNGNGEHWINFQLTNANRIRSIRVWNYNKSVDDTYRGVKILHVWIDNKKVSPEQGYLLRRAPGHFLYDYVQEIVIGQSVGDTIDLNNCQHLPCGFVYQFNLFSAWNDLYYIGLNGFDFYDHTGQRIEIEPNQIYAYPESVNSLTPKQQRTSNTMDVRTPDKLIDHVNNTFDPKHMWLAPILPNCLNRIFVVFNRPAAVSMIRIWNYSKTPLRGVKEFSVLVDDLLIHSGTLPAAVSTTVTRGILPNMNDVIAPSNQHKTILWDKFNPILLASEKGHILENCDYHGQDVVLTNNNESVSTNSANQNLRPVTSVYRDRCKNRVK